MEEGLHTSSQLRKIYIELFDFSRRIEFELLILLAKHNNTKLGFVIPVQPTRAELGRILQGKGQIKLWIPFQQDSATAGYILLAH